MPSTLNRKRPSKSGELVIRKNPQLPQSVHIRRHGTHPSSTLPLKHLLQSAPDDTRCTCRSESGAWLNALPVSALSLRMDDDTVHVAMGLRLGTPLCLPHVCHHCRAEVINLGTHGLSCRKTQGRHPQHSSINSLIQRHLSAAGNRPTLNPLAFATLMANILMVHRSCPGVVAGY